MSYKNGANMVGVPWKKVFEEALGKPFFISICCILSKLFNKPIGI